MIGEAAIDCRVVLVGEKGVGKTALIDRFLGVGNGQVRPQSKTINVGEQQVCLFISEISDLSSCVSDLAMADVTLLCFDVTQPRTLTASVRGWIDLAPRPLVLVGCQSDKRRGPRGGLPHVSRGQALAVSKQLGFSMYVETETKISDISALTVFEVSALTYLGQVSSSENSPTSPLLGTCWPSTRSNSASRCDNTRESTRLVGGRLGGSLANIRSRSSSRLSISTGKPSSSRLSISTGRAPKQSSSRLSLSSGRPPRPPQDYPGTKTSEQTVTILCQRLKGDKTSEEIEIDVPMAVFSALEPEHESVEWEIRKGSKEGGFTKCIMAMLGRGQ